MAKAPVTEQPDESPWALPARVRHLLFLMGYGLQNINDRLEDDGDRVYLGSTNDKDLLQQMSDEFASYVIDTHDTGSDLLETIGLTDSRSATQ